jgi:hypothetical protein
MALTHEEMQARIQALGYRGELIECTQEEYRDGLRNELHRQAGKWIDTGQGMRALMVLEEIRRLDARFRENS